MWAERCARNELTRSVCNCICSDRWVAEVGLGHKYTLPQSQPICCMVAPLTHTQEFSMFRLPSLGKSLQSPVSSLSSRLFAQLKQLTLTLSLAANLTEAVVGGKHLKVNSQERTATAAKQSVDCFQYQIGGSQHMGLLSRSY